MSKKENALSIIFGNHNHLIITLKSSPPPIPMLDDGRQELGLKVCPQDQIGYFLSDYPKKETKNKQTSSGSALQRISTTMPSYWAS